MSGRFDIVLTDVPDDKKIIAAKILAELLSINLLFSVIVLSLGN